MDQMETVNLTQLQPGKTIEINHNIYTFKGSVIAAETFEELLIKLHNRPTPVDVVVIVPGVSEDIETNISNYVLNKLYRKPKDQQKLVSNKTLDKLSDDDISKLSNGNEALNTLWFLLRQLAFKQNEYTSLTQELDILTSKRNFNNITPSELERGGYLYNNLIPETKAAIDQLMTSIDAQRNQLLQLSQKELKDAVQFSEHMEQMWQTPTPTDDTDDTDKPVTEAELNEIMDAFSKQSAQESVSADNGAFKQLCSHWRNAAFRRMPLSVARQLMNRPDMLKYRKNQHMIDGYITVPPELLIMCGIEVYDDDLPIVFTPSGEFQRVGSSAEHDMDMLYWYPKPAFCIDSDREDD